MDITDLYKISNVSFDENKYKSKLFSQFNTTTCVRIKSELHFKCSENNCQRTAHFRCKENTCNLCLVHYCSS